MAQWGVEERRAAGGGAPARRADGSVLSPGSSVAGGPQPDSGDRSPGRSATAQLDEVLGGGIPSHPKSSFMEMSREQKDQHLEALRRQMEQRKRAMRERMAAAEQGAGDAEGAGRSHLLSPQSTSKGLSQAHSLVHSRGHSGSDDGHGTHRGGRGPPGRRSYDRGGALAAPLSPGMSDLGHPGGMDAHEPAVSLPPSVAGGSLTPSDLHSDADSGRHGRFHVMDTPPTGGPVGVAYSSSSDRSRAGAGRSGEGIPRRDWEGEGAGAGRAAPAGRGRGAGAGARPTSRGRGGRPESAPRQRQVAPPAPVAKNAWGPSPPVPQPRPGSAPRPRPTEPEEFHLSQATGKRSKEAVARRIEQERLREMTFQPHVLHVPTKVDLSRPVLERFEADQRRRREKMSRKVAERTRELEEEAAATYTHRPELVAGYESKLSATDRNATVLDRAQRAIQKKRQFLEREQQKLVEEELAEVTGAPDRSKTQERKLPHDYVPIHERLESEMAKRHARLSEKRAGQEKEHSYQPALCRKSMALAEERQLRKDLWANELAARGELPASGEVPDYVLRRVKSDAHLTPADRECTFQPMINNRSRQMMEIHPRRAEDFLDRLQQGEEERQAHRDAIARKAEDRECTFKPGVSAGSVRLMATSARLSQHLGESFLERVERLSYHDAERREAVKATLAEHYYGQYPFKPSLRHPAGAKGHSVEDLVSNEQHKARIERLRQQAEERLEQECTFQPDTSKPALVGEDKLPYRRDAARVDKVSVALGDPDALLDRIRQQEQTREQWLAAERERRALQELEQCTFAPEVHGVPEPQGPVMVKGTDQFYRRKEYAKRLEDELRERQAKVFVENPRARTGVTLGMQPRLASEARSKEKQQSEKLAHRREHVASLIQRHEDELTFQPKTNHASRKSLVARIMREHSRGSSVAGDA